MTEDELLYATLDDKAAECDSRNIITNTNFLDVFQQSKVIALLNRRKVRYSLYGGFSDSERKIAVFLPDYVDGIETVVSEPDLSPLCVLIIRKDSFSELSHRDYLGAIMGLGVRRDMLGDIAVTKDGCAVAVMKSIADYIAENLVSVGRGSVSVAVSDDFSLYDKEEKYDIKRCYVSSMRLDSVVSAAFSLSRSAANEKIKRGEVFLNGIEVLKPDAHVPFSSKIVIHGRGKVIVDSDEGITKKGRQAFTVKIY